MLLPLMGIALVLAAAFQWPGLDHFWLPESIGPRATDIDSLLTNFHLLLAAFLLIYSLLLASVMWRFGANNAGPSTYWKGDWRLEAGWTIVPAFVLIGLSLYQYPIWQKHKVTPPFQTSGTAENVPQVPFARVVAQQYHWQFVYPGPDALFDTRDDLFSEGELIVPVNQSIVLELVSKDVIHGFCVNQLRLKQDIVPGFASRVWFEIRRTGEWEIVCSELCGWGHYKMKAKLRCVSQEDFASWLTALRNDQFNLSPDSKP